MTEKRKYADRPRQNIEAVTKRRKRVRVMAIEMLGGGCKICGYSKCQQALDFHHRDDSNKRFGISAKGYTRSWKAIREEVSKCYLLCSNCHREIHAGVTQLPREIGVEKQGELTGSSRKLRLFAE